MAAKQRSGVVPYLIIKGGKSAIDFYKRAFAAKVIESHLDDDGERVTHCHLRINGGDVMFADPFPEFGSAEEEPGGFTLVLKVDDADLWWQRARKAGAEVTMPLEEQSWGDRYGELRDPFGYAWSISAPVKATRPRRKT